MRTVTLATLIASVRKRADIVALTSRHTDAEITTLINESWRELRGLVTREGSPMFLSWTTPAAMAVGVVAGHGFGSIPMPSDAVLIHGIDVVVNPSDIRALTPISFQERNKYLVEFGSSTGVPRHFCALNYGTESTTSLTAGTIAVLPAPDAAYSYMIAYVKDWTDITTTTHVFNTVVGWDSWLVWDVAVKIGVCDTDPALVAMATAERERCWNVFVLPTIRVQRVGPVTKIDAQGMNRRQRLVTR
jgi:hypothetical protein